MLPPSTQAVARWAKILFLAVIALFFTLVAFTNITDFDTNYQFVRHVLAMDTTQAKLAFQVISERYDFRRSTCITTNRPFKDWPKVFPDALNAQVIAERLTERSEHFVLEKGYRNAHP